MSLDAAADAICIVAAVGAFLMIAASIMAPPRPRWP
jgi:hypothetical protein